VDAGRTVVVHGTTWPALGCAMRSQSVSWQQAGDAEFGGEVRGEDGL
jgi:hypothetical protein